MNTRENKEVRVVDLVKNYKELRAIDGLSLDIDKGDIFGLLGPNGCGKTTLINCILSLLSYDSGEIYIFGEKMSPSSSNIRQQIGLVPQDIAVYEELNVYENIDYFCGLYIDDKNERKRLVEEAIDFVKLGDFRKMLPKKLSGGLKRRLNLACGVAHKPRLLFLDEPTVAVDPQSRNRILEGIAELRDKGTTVVYTTHYMEEVEMICNRLVIMDRGRVISSGSSEEIISNSSVGEAISIECPELPEEFLKMLTADDAVISSEYSDNRLKLRVKSGDSYLIKLLKLFEKFEISPSEINSRKPTLNDVFLEITGKELRDHA